jgi:hypothetical protein
MPAQADISVVFKEQNARGEWVEVCVQGSTLEDFRPVINRLGQCVKTAHSELFARRRYLGAVLIQLRNRFPRGHWGPFVASLGMNLKTVWSSIKIVETLCDERGEINEVKRRAALAAKPAVRELPAGRMTLRNAEELSGIRSIEFRNVKVTDLRPSPPVHYPSVGFTAVNLNAEQNPAQMSTRADICTEQAAVDKFTAVEVSPFGASEDGFDVDDMDDADFDGQMVDASDQPDIDGDDDGDEWLIGEQMTFADLRAQASQILTDALNALDSMDESQRGALEQLIRDAGALLNAAKP